MKKERQEQERERERDRERETEKGGGQKRLMEKKRETLKINKKCPFYKRGKNKVVFLY